MPGRRILFAVVFKCWLGLFPRYKKVLEPKDDRHGCVWVWYESGFNFLLILDFCHIIKGKDKNGYKKITQWAVGSYRWRSHLNQIRFDCPQISCGTLLIPALKRTVPHSNTDDMIQGKASQGWRQEGFHVIGLDLTLLARQPEKVTLSDCGCTRLKDVQKCQLVNVHFESLRG